MVLKGYYRSILKSNVMAFPHTRLIASINITFPFKIKKNYPVLRIYGQLVINGSRYPTGLDTCWVSATK